MPHAPQPEQSRRSSIRLRNTHRAGPRHGTARMAACWWPLNRSGSDMLADRTVQGDCHPPFLFFFFPPPHPPQSTRQAAPRHDTARTAACWWPLNRSGSDMPADRTAQADCRPPVRPQARGEWPHRVSPSVHRHFRVQTQQPSARIGIGGQPVLMLARVRSGDQMLTAILQPAERCFARQRQPGNGKLPQAATGTCSQTHRRHQVR